MDIRAAGAYGSSLGALNENETSRLLSDKLSYPTYYYIGTQWPVQKQTLSLQWLLQKQTLNLHETRKITRRNIHIFCTCREKRVCIFCLSPIFTKCKYSH